MIQLYTGEFYGQTNQTLHLDGVTLTDTEYTHNFVDWHYHENAYFTFILQGNVIEGNKKEIYHCSAGSLLFHRWQEPHYNIKPEGYTRGFHVELKDSWFRALDFAVEPLQGSIKIASADVKFLLYKIFNESKLQDEATDLAVQSLLLQALDEMSCRTHTALDRHPAWVKKIKEILFDEFADKLTLAYLSETLAIHPVHLSRDFPKYFHCNLGDYLRKLKIEKSYALLCDKRLSLTEIAYLCGFADQSHFNRCFKSVSGISPSRFRKTLFGPYASC